MHNVANTPAYQINKQEWGWIFIPENIHSDDTYEVSDRLKLHTVMYVKSEVYRRYTASENEFRDEHGHVIASWRAINDYAARHKYIKHSNGKEYLIFRQDIFGYSVLDIATGQIMQYYPRRSFEDTEETFIWAQLDYNPLNDLIAITGCIWGGPYGIMLITFADPMSEDQLLLDIGDYGEEGNEFYHYDFKQWDGENLVLVQEDRYTDEKEKITYTPEDYQDLFYQKAIQL